MKFELPKKQLISYQLWKVIIFHNYSWKKALLFCYFQKCFRLSNYQFICYGNRWIIQVKVEWDCCSKLTFFLFVKVNINFLKCFLCGAKICGHFDFHSFILLLKIIQIINDYLIFLFGLIYIFELFSSENLKIKCNLLSKTNNLHKSMCI